MSKTNGNNRVSALKRLTKASPITMTNRREPVGSIGSSIADARELLSNRNKTVFDARQILSRQSSQTANVILRNAIVQNKIQSQDKDGKMVVVTGIKSTTVQNGQVIPTERRNINQNETSKAIFSVGSSTLVTIRNNGNNKTNTSSNLSLTKTIKNSSVDLEDVDQFSKSTNIYSSLLDRKVAVSIVNDKYKEASDLSESPFSTMSVRSASQLIQRTNPPPIIKRLHDASIQTASAPSSSRPPIRINSHRQHIDTSIQDSDHSFEQTIADDLYEPPTKRSNSSLRRTTATTTTNTESDAPTTKISIGSVKRTSTGVPISSRISSSNPAPTKSAASIQPNSTSGIILVTNLQPSVTEEDVIELFGEVGRINEVTTLSQGCVQIIYSKREFAEQAVAKYHNRLLDGQFMYVSLQQPPTYSTAHSTKSTTNNQRTQPENDNEITNNSSTADNQPLKFNSSKSVPKKLVIDPAFIRQALFNPTNNSTNPVQFQVKL